MGVRMPETCWAVFKRQVINLRSCRIWLFDSVESLITHGLANSKFLREQKDFHQIWNWSMISIYDMKKTFHVSEFLSVTFKIFKLTCHTTSLCWKVWLGPAFSNSSLGLATHSHYMRCSVCLFPNASRPTAESENKRRHVWAVPSHN
jgi:hypothetical protein